MSYLLRDAADNDMVGITEIYQHAVRYGTASFELDPPSIEEMAERRNTIVSKGYPYVVAVDETDGSVLGYAYASSYRARPAYRWTVENSVYVAQKAQGRGIGKALTRLVIDRCAASGFRQMIAIIGGSDHHSSISMHTALGFAHVGNLPATGFKHGKWLDSVVMQLALGEGAHSDPDLESFPGRLHD